MAKSKALVKVGSDKSKMEKILTPITPENRMKLENAIQEKKDDEGNRWHKVYSGGGSHFRNWLDQIKEIYGEENVEVEEVNSSGLQCYEEGGEKMYRIWAKQIE